MDPAILSQTLMSVLKLPATPKKASTQREKTREKHVGCQYSSMLCFHMYEPRTNSEYASKSDSLQWQEHFKW